MSAGAEVPGEGPGEGEAVSVSSTGSEVRQSECLDSLSFKTAGTRSSLLFLKVAALQCQWAGGSALRHLQSRAVATQLGWCSGVAGQLLWFS